MGMNAGRILGGGLAAGLVANVIDGGGNVMLLAPRWKAETDALNPDIFLRAASGSAVGWIITDFLLCLVLVWLYAAMRTRFGPGPRTAVVAALAVWFVSHAYFASYIFMGLYSPGLIVTSSLIALVALVAGGLVGGKIYQE